MSSVFLPLFAVVLARAVVPQAPVALSWVAWGAGLLAYGWINPGDVTAWRDTMHFIFATVLRAPFPLDGELSRIPATAASFVVAAGGYLVIAWPMQRRRRS